MKFFLLTFCLFALSIAFIPFSADAQGSGGQNADYSFVSITEIPTPSIAGDVDTANLSFDGFIRIIFALSVSIAALLAVVKIIYGGVQYMLTDVVPQKGEAKKTIYGAILGLIIVMSAVFILQQINPQLTQFDLIKNAPTLKPAGSGSGGEAAVGRPDSNSTDQGNSASSEFIP